MELATGKWELLNTGRSYEDKFKSHCIKAKLELMVVYGIPGEALLSRERGEEEL